MKKLGNVIIQPNSSLFVVSESVSGGSYIVFVLCGGNGYILSHRIRSSRRTFFQLRRARLFDRRGPCSRCRLSLSRFPAPEAFPSIARILYHITGHANGYIFQNFKCI